MSLAERILKNTRIKETAVLSESKFFNEKSFLPTKIPLISVALSGKVDGGLGSGTLVLAGPSKHFKSGFALLLASTYLRAHPDAVLLFYDSEFGSPKSYFDTFGIDKSRVIHTPVLTVEQLKNDLIYQLAGDSKNPGISRGDKMIVVVDSIGNLASLKEVEDAVDQKTVADMTRARAIKSLFRVCAPHFALKDIPLIVLNHTYKEMSLFPTEKMSGGTGPYYNADNIWIVGRQQDKKDTEILGYNFVINVEKSRYVREKSKFPINVSYDSGIDRWSGLLDIALEGGYLEKDKRSYVSKHLPGDKFSGDELANPTTGVWPALLSKTDFADYIQKRYALVGDEAKRIISNEEEEIENV